MPIGFIQWRTRIKIFSSHILLHRHYLCLMKLWKSLFPWSFQQNSSHLKGFITNELIKSNSKMICIYHFYTIFICSLSVSFFFYVTLFRFIPTFIHITSESLHVHQNLESQLCDPFFETGFFPREVENFELYIF